MSKLCGRANNEAEGRERHHTRIHTPDSPGLRKGERSKEGNESRFVRNDQDD